MSCNIQNFGNNNQYINKQITPAKKQEFSAQAQNQQDMDTLTKYYTKTLDSAAGESLKGLLISGPIMALAIPFPGTFHPRIFVHPINTFKAFKPTSKMFKPEGEIAKLWQTHNPMMQEAYRATHRIIARSYSKLGLFRAKMDQKTCDELTKIMSDALKTHNPEKIIEATQRLNAVVKGPRFRDLFKKLDGKIPKLIRKWYNGSKCINPLDSAKNLVIQPNQMTELLGNAKNPTFVSFIKKQGVKGFVQGMIVFAAMDLLMGWSKYKDAKAKDKKSGNKQLGQTLANACLGGIGWPVGEALGLSGFALLCKKLGKHFKPGIGSSIGLVTAFTSGCIGLHYLVKLFRPLIGQDVADKVKAENMAKTEEGKMEILKTAYEAAQKGDKNMDAQTKLALQRIIAQSMEQQMFAKVDGTNKTQIGLTTEEIDILKKKGLSTEEILQVAVYKKQMEEQQLAQAQQMKDMQNAKPLESKSLLNENAIASTKLQGTRGSSSANRNYVPSSKCKVTPQGQMPLPDNVSNAFVRADMAEQDALDTLKKA